MKPYLMYRHHVLLLHLKFCNTLMLIFVNKENNVNLFLCIPDFMSGYSIKVLNPSTAIRITSSKLNCLESEFGFAVSVSNNLLLTFVCSGISLDF